MLIALLIFSLVSPILALIYSCYQLVKTRKTYYCFAIVVIYAFYCTVLPPVADAYQYMMRYQDAGESVYAIANTLLNDNKVDELYDYICIMFKFLNFDFFDFRFVLYLSALACWAFAFKDIVGKNKEIFADRKLCIFSLLIFALAINCFRLAFFVRYMPAAFWMFGSFYLALSRRNILWFGLAIIAFFFHFSTLAFLVVLVCTFLFHKIKIPDFFKIFAPVALLFLSSLFENTLLFFEDYTNYNFGSETYIYGYWADPHDKTVNRELHLLAEFFIFIAMYYICILRNKKSQTFLTNSAIFCSWLVFFVYPYEIIRERFIWFTFLLLLADFLINIVNNRECIRKCICIICLLLIWNSLDLYAFRKSAFSYVPIKSMLLPAWTLRYDFYDSHWILKNLNSQGGFNN